MKVRDKKRIKPFMNELAEIWETQCPDCEGKCNTSDEWHFKKLWKRIRRKLGE